MTKKSLLATLLLSTALLTSSVVNADEGTTPVDGTTPVVVTPTEPTQPVDVPAEPAPAPETEAPLDTTTPIETPGDPSVPAPTEPTTPPSTDETKQPEVTPEAPKTEEKPATDKPVSKPEVSQPVTPQEGQVSKATNQMISTVTPEAPIETNSGVSVVSTKEGQVILSDGSEVAPEEIGAKTNDDKTITVTKKDGSKVTLPHTGEAKNLGLSLLGAIVALTGALIWKQKKVQDN